MGKEIQNLEKLEQLVSAMSACTPQELCAAIAMLPDYANNGLAVVMAAAAKTISEHFEDTDAAVDKLKDLISQMKEEKEEEQG